MVVWSCRSVDTSAALAMDGVHHYISAVDVPGSNMTGTVLRDEELFATEKVCLATSAECTMLSIPL